MFRELLVSHYGRDLIFTRNAEGRAVDVRGSEPKLCETLIDSRNPRRVLESLAGLHGVSDFQEMLELATGRQQLTLAPLGQHDFQGSVRKRLLPGRGRRLYPEKRS